MTIAWELKRAELTSGIGALVLGIGLGAGAARLLAGSWIAILAAGALLHGWGMYHKHRLEQGTGAEPIRYAAFLYWLCWGLLATVGIFLLVARG